MVMRQDLFEYMWQFLTEERQQRFLEIVEDRTRYVTVVLEDLYQTHNASAALRSCDCFGIQDVHVIENKWTYQLNKDVDMGSAKWVDVHKYSEKESNTVECINHLKSEGYTVVATTPHTEMNTIDKLPLDSKIALMFGTEISGLTDTALEHADAKVVIPMYGFTESFNISVSVALCLYTLATRLREENIDFRLTEKERQELLLDWTMKTVRSAEQIKNRYLVENPQ